MNRFFDIRRHGPLNMVSHQLFWKSGVTGLVIAVMLILSACVVEGSSPQKGLSNDGHGGLGQTISQRAMKSYLNARVAEKDGDFRRAAQLMETALTRDSDSRPLREKTVFLYLLAGDFDKATQLSKPLFASLNDDMQKPSTGIKPARLAPHSAGLGPYNVQRQIFLSLFYYAQLIKQGENDKLRRVIRAEGQLAQQNAILAIYYLASLVGDGHYEAAHQAVTDYFGDGSGQLTIYIPAKLYMMAGDYDKALAVINLIGDVEAAPLPLIKLYLQILLHTGKLTEAMALTQASLGNFYTDEQLHHIWQGLTRLRNDINAANMAENMLDSQTQARMAGLMPLANDAGSFAADLLMQYLPAFDFQGIPAKLIVLRLAQFGLPETQKDNPDSVAFAQRVVEEIYDQNYNILARQELQKLKRSGIDGPPLSFTEAALLVDDEETKAAISLLQASAANSPDKPSIYQLLAYSRITIINRMIEDYEAAATASQQALTIYDQLGISSAPMRGYLLYQLGMAQERAGQWDKAEIAFLDALKERPNDPNILNYLGYSWVDMKRNLDKGLAMIQQAAKLNPEGFIIDSLGWAYFRLGRFDEAVETLERAVTLTPYDPTINDHLGDAYWQVGRIREAQFQWQRALDFKPDDNLKKTILEKLANSANHQTASLDDLVTSQD